jgi:hypothetical protein
LKNVPGILKNALPSQSQIEPLKNRGWAGAAYSPQCPVDSGRLSPLYTEKSTLVSLRLSWKPLEPKPEFGGLILCGFRFNRCFDNFEIIAEDKFIDGHFQALLIINSFRQIVCQIH